MLMTRAGMAQSVEQLGYRLDDQGFGVRFPAGGRDSSIHHNVQTGSGAYPASYTIVTGAFSRGKAGYSPTYIVEVKNGGAITSLPHMASRRGA
jgi:hypothetical protein